MTISRLPSHHCHIMLGLSTLTFSRSHELLADTSFFIIMNYFTSFYELLADTSFFYYNQIKTNNRETLEFENHVTQNLLGIIS